MNLTSEQIERLRPGFETWFLSACQFDDPKILDRNGAGYMWSGPIWAFRGYLALASAMLGEEAINRGTIGELAGAGYSPEQIAGWQAEPETWEDLQLTYRAVLAAALFGGAG